VIGPADAPAVFNVAELPSPETVPLLAVQPLTVTGTLSGLVQVQVMLELPPACNELGLAEQDMVGGFFGGSFTV
jgi:chorismate mutase